MLVNTQIPVETLSPSRLNNLDAMQEGRFLAACEKSASELRSIFRRDRIDTPDVAITNVTTENVSYDNPVLNANSLMALEAVTPDVKSLIDAISDTEVKDLAELTTVASGNESLTIRKYDRGTTLSLKVDQNELTPKTARQSEVFAEQVKARFARSPAHREYSRMRNEVNLQAVPPEIVISRPFNPAEDVLGTLAFLEDADLLSTSSRNFAPDFVNSDDPQAFLNAKLEAIPSYRAIRREGESATSYTWGNKAKRMLIVDHSTGNYTFSVRQNPAGWYLETANQSPEAKAVPFIETECAEQLCAVLDQAGLMLHPDLQAEIMNPADADRYGSIYTQLSREVAKWVNHPEKTQISKLVVPADGEFYGTALLKDGVANIRYRAQDYASRSDYDREPTEDTESVARQRWESTTHEVTSESAAALLCLIDQSLTRAKTTELASQLPVTKQSIMFRDGACFDVLGYYFGASQEPFAGKGLQQVSVNEVPLLEKTLGSHTFMTLQSMTFNGVELPKGALLAQQSDGWAFLRLTAFCFDQPSDQIAAAGSELDKALKNEADAVRRLGGTTLSHLVSDI